MFITIGLKVCNRFPLETKRGLFVLCLILNGLLGYGQQKFKVLRLENKIPGHEYQNIPMVQDSLGYMWIGRIDGITKYNGHEFMPIPYERIFQRKIGDDRVDGIVKDRDGVLWIRSRLGFVSRMNAREDFTPQSTTGAPLENYRITRILPDEEKLWMSTSEGQLLRFDIRSATMEHEHTLPGSFDWFNRVVDIVMSGNEVLYLLRNTAELIRYDPQLDISKEIPLPEETPKVFGAEMTIDKKQRIWIGTTDKDVGILIYDPEIRKFVQGDLLSEEVLNGCRASFFEIISDSQDNIWLGTEPDGLFRIDPERNQLDTLNYSIFDSNSLSSNSIGDLYEDENRNLWIMCDYGNINVVLRQDADQIVQTHSAALYNNPARVHSLFKSQDGSLWFGTEGKGILHLDPNTGKEEAYLVEDDYSSGFSVQSILEVDTNTVWIATIGDGLWAFDKIEKKAVRVPLVDREGERALIVHKLYRDQRDRVWVLTEMGFFVYAVDGTPLAQFTEATFRANRAQGRDISETPDGTLWISAKNGLYRLTEDSTDFKQSDLKLYDFFENKKADLVFAGIRSMDADNEGVLWLIGYGGHLYSFDTKTAAYQDYTHIQALERINFQTVRAEDKENIWLGAVSGLWRLNPKTGDYAIFSKNDGFLDSRFLASSYKDEDGRLYFPSLSGVNHFDPKKLEKRGTKAQLLIDGIEILNEPALSVIPEQLAQGISKVDRIELSYEQASFSIRFLALEDVLSPNYHYSYRLKGFDDDWVTPLNARTASYTKVPDGTYEFEVRAGTEAGLWDIAPRTVQIHIAPPFYRHPLAYLSYVLIVAGVLIAFIRWLRLRRDLVIQQLERESDRQLYEMKMDFFSKISHEIQTPLSLILIPIENMLRSATLNKSPTMQRRLNMVSHNVKRLSRIVFELTSVRNKEIGKLKANFVRRDLKTDLARVKQSFQELADRKKVELTVESEETNWEAVYDSEKLEHVFYNLLSNAFKFTPEGGKVEIGLKRDSREEAAIISIMNTGATISQKDQEHIFELFYQGGENQHSGTGIGLALSKELVELHQGSITVDSNNGVTCFTVVLPLDLPAAESADRFPEKGVASAEDQLETFITEADHTTVAMDFDKTVLIVEDNFELRDYLKALFKDYYNVLLAVDGEEGYQLAVKELPQLIVSDIMMPKKNGITMAKELRNTSATAHIPIILMTAEDNPRNRVSSLRAGVIEYMAKPFSTNELLLKSHNIVTRGERLASKIKADFMVSPSRPTAKSRDELFLESLVDHIDARMEDAEFRVEELSKLMHMSHSSLYRKCQGLTGKTLVEFVRSMRLKKAAMYLTETDYSVADAAYVVGFNDVKYFSKCFRKEFGKSPIAYKKMEI